MSFNIVPVAITERDKAAASTAMIAIQGSIPYSKVLHTVAEAIAVARAEERKRCREIVLTERAQHRNGGTRNACMAIANEIGH
jgi:hypothetical protein